MGEQRIAGVHDGQPFEVGHELLAAHAPLGDEHRNDHHVAVGDHGKVVVIRLAGMRVDRQRPGRAIASRKGSAMQAPIPFSILRLDICHFFFIFLNLSAINIFQVI